ncbi:hypothetical protein BSM4216_1642 [Bacillus smithii]|nr:hypothetical protein BSM4216_1642 [Bacillus smithii]
MTGRKIWGIHFSHWYLLNFKTTPGKMWYNLQRMKDKREEHHSKFC